MFGVGFGEIVLIAIVVMVFFGPSKLPEVMRQVGKIYVHFRRYSNEFRNAFDKAVKDIEDEVLTKEREKIRDVLLDESKILSATKAELQHELHSVGAVIANPSFGLEHSNQRFDQSVETEKLTEKLNDHLNDKSIEKPLVILVPQDNPIRE